MSDVQGLGFGPQVRALMARYKSVARNIVAGSAADVFEIMTREQLSSTITGTYREGYVPVKTGELADSTVAFLNGDLVASGKVSWRAIAARMGTSDRLVGGFTAPQAFPMEYGFFHKGAGRQIPGRFFRENAAMQWPIVVRENYRYYTRNI